MPTSPGNEDGRRQLASRLSVVATDESPTARRCSLRRDAYNDRAVGDGPTVDRNEEASYPWRRAVKEPRNDLFARPALAGDENSGAAAGDSFYRVDGPAQGFRFPDECQSEVD